MTPLAAKRAIAALEHVSAKPTATASTSRAAEARTSALSVAALRPAADIKVLHVRLRRVARRCRADKAVAHIRLAGKLKARTSADRAAVFDKVRACVA